MTILESQITGPADAARRIAELEALVAKLKTNGTRRLSFKVSENTRCLSVYGMNVRGIHLYAGQWLKVLDAADELRAFIEAHRDELAWKD